MCPCINCVITKFYKRSNKGLLFIPANIPSSVVEVDLSYNKISYLRKTTFIEYWRCTDLDLHHNKIQEIEIGSFSSFLNTETLWLDHNYLGYVKHGYFFELQSLKTLSLASNRIAMISEGSFATQTRLKSLVLSGNSLKSLSSDMMKGLISLQYLHLVDNKIRDIEKFAFKYVAKLILLHLRNNFITNIHRNMLTGLHNLLELDLTSNDISTIKKEAFLQVRNFKTLTLVNNRVATFEGYVGWSIIYFPKDRLSRLNVKKERIFQRTYENEFKENLKIAEKKVMERELRINQLENEIKNLKETLEKTREECGIKKLEEENALKWEDENEELHRGFIRIILDQASRIASTIQEQTSETVENIWKRLNYNQNKGVKDDKNEQETPRMSLEQILGQLQNSPAIALGIIIISGITSLIVFLSNILNLNLFRW